MDKSLSHFLCFFFFLFFSKEGYYGHRKWRTVSWLGDLEKNKTGWILLSFGEIWESTASMAKLSLLVSSMKGRFLFG